MKKKTLVFTVAVALIASATFFYQPYKVVSKSMQPTLVENDLVVFKKFDVTASLKRGDIVMFNVLSNPNVVKRIIGLPGDRITYTNKLLSVIKTINNSELPNTATMPNSTLNLAKKGVETDMSDDAVERIMYSTYLGEISGKSYKYKISAFVPSREKHFFQQEDMPVGQWLVPDNMIFVLGDNRDLSLDSRIYGFIPFENINGIM